MAKTFDIEKLYSLSLPVPTQLILFSAFAVAFAVKIPVVPFHTWLPDAHVEAPTAGSVILAGVLLKMGIYGFIRLAMPLFPQALEISRPILLTLAVIGAVYGALVAMVQTDLKKLVAYTSISHLGLILLGLVSLTPQGVAGATLQMVNHGISTGALFLLVGMLYQQSHTRQISSFGGLATAMPLYTVLFLIVSLSSLGLPATNGFVGEFLILLGAFYSDPSFAAVAGTSVIFSAITLLWMIRRVFFGPIPLGNRDLKDLSSREAVVLLPLVILIFWLGLQPGFLLKRMDQTVERFLDRTVVFVHGKSHH